MSDFPAFVPPYSRSSRSTDLPFKASRVPDDEHPRRRLDDDDVDDVDDVDDAEDIAAPAVREGLPPTYRMRHEPHYVETLAAPAGSASVPSAAPVTTDTTAAGGPALAAVATSLAAALDAIHHSLASLTTAGRPLRERVALDVVRAEAIRARWLTDAAAALETDPLPALDEVDLGDVLRSIDGSLALERRLTGEGPTIAAPLDTCRVFGDEQLLTSALGGVLTALRTLVEDRGDQAKVTAAVDTRVDAASRTRTVVITQAAVRVSPAVLTRFFDAGWVDHPAGRTGAVMLAAARRIAAAHGGGLELGAIDGGGFRLSLSLPAAG